MFLSSPPSLYDDVAKPVGAVAGRRGPAHVHDEEELVFICPFDKDAHEEDVPRAEHHLPLPVWVAVCGVLVQSHLGDEVSSLGGQGEVYHTGGWRKKAISKLIHNESNI